MLSEARQILDGHRSSVDVERFLSDSLPTMLCAALDSVLPPGTEGVRCTVTRSKLKPGRKLTVSVDVAGLGPDPRPVTATWTLDGPGSTVTFGADAAGVPQALRSPFTDLRVDDNVTGMTVLISPLDPAFPQLARLHDPAALLPLLTAAALDPGPSRPTVTTVRYRPGQRHVLRIDLGTGESLFAKCYRDDAGARAVAARTAVAEALAARGNPAYAAVPLAYLAGERVVLWRAGGGHPLSRVVHAAPASAAAAGQALRAIHDSPCRDAASVARSDPAAEALATLRSCEHIAALAPESARVVSSVAARAAVALADLPAEGGHLLHGDYKCDNILLDGDRLEILDFDRVTAGDPALDLGKVCADLRWWAQTAGVDAAPLVSSLLMGYGHCPPARRHRAGLYDVLFQLRAAGRRVPLHEPGWSERVEAVVDAARNLPVLP